MKITQENKNYLVYIAKYLGVALISGSAVHIGTLQNGVFRYVILMIIGIVLMMLGNISEARQSGVKINANFLIIITSLSLATGFLSGGVQHYLDNPMYAGYLLGIGAVVTYITFFLKDKIALKTKDIFIVVCIALSIFFFSSLIVNKYIEIGHTGAGSHHAE